MTISSKAIAVLKYCAEFVREQKNDRAYLIGILTRVMPLIERIAPVLHLKWRRKAKNYSKKCVEFEADAIREFQHDFESLKLTLIAEDLMDDPVINKCKIALESIFDNRPEFIMPPPSDVAYDNFSKICYRLLDLGRDDLLIHYAKVKYVEAYRYQEQNPKTGFTESFCGNFCGFFYNVGTACKDELDMPIPFEDLPSNWTCPRCGDSKNSFTIHRYKVWMREAQIKRFTMAPSFFNLQRLQASFDLTRPSRSVWIAYAYLYRLIWSTEVSRDYFRQKALYHQQKVEAKVKNKPKKAMDTAACARDAQLMDLHFTHVEIKALYSGSPLRTKSGRKLKQIIYSRDRIDRNLNIILEYIYKLDVGHIESLPMPSSIKLGIEDCKYLRLFVKWASGLIEVITLHTFADDENSYAFKFIDELIAEGFSKMNPDAADGLNATKYLQRVGIKGVLDELCIAQKTRYSAELRPNFPIFNIQSAMLAKKVRKYVEKFETERWD
jgi:rubredoxin